MKELKPLLEQYKEICKRDPEGFIAQVGKYPSIRKILVEVYQLLVKEGRCDKIEDLDSEEKMKLWNQAKKVSVVQERNYVIEVCKALHGFGTYLQLEKYG